MDIRLANFRNYELLIRQFISFVEETTQIINQMKRRVTYMYKQVYSMYSSGNGIFS